MVRISLASSLFLLSLSLSTVLASPLNLRSPLTPDPAGAKNVGNGAGQQFITGACLSNADCASGCCATFSGGGICSGVGAQFESGKSGCGFGGASNTGAAAVAAPAVTASATGTAAGSGASPTVTSTVHESIPGAENVGNGAGKQFITGQCLADEDCASGCCATLNGAGQCSGPAVSTTSGKQGCGFVGVLA